MARKILRDPTLGEVFRAKLKGQSRPIVVLEREKLITRKIKLFGTKKKKTSFKKKLKKARKFLSGKSAVFD